MILVGDNYDSFTCNLVHLFGELGERAENQIQQLQDQLAGPDPPNETYLEKVGRLNMARLQAEEVVLPELISAERAGDRPQKLFRKTPFAVSWSVRRRTCSIRR